MKISINIKRAHFMYLLLLIVAFSAVISFAEVNKNQAYNDVNEIALGGETTPFKAIDDDENGKIDATAIGIMVDDQEVTLQEAMDIALAGATVDCTWSGWYCRNPPHGNCAGDMRGGDGYYFLTDAYCEDGLITEFYSKNLGSPHNYEAPRRLNVA